MISAIRRALPGGIYVRSQMLGGEAGAPLHGSVVLNSGYALPNAIAGLASAGGGQVE